MSKKLSKEEMEQDLLIEYSSRFMHFYQNNKAAIISGSVGLVAVVGLIIGYFIYSAQQEEEAQNLMGIAERYYSEGDLEKALYGDEEDFSVGFSQIAKNYPNTKPGNLANYYAGVVEFELGNYDSALNYLNNFNPPDGILGVAPVTFHAVLLMELERFEEAAGKFEEAANRDKNEVTTPENYLRAAEAYLDAENNDKAEEMISVITEEYQTSQYATEALRLRGFIASK